MTSGSLLWTAGRLSSCCLPKSKCMHTTSLGHPGTVAWSCWSRRLLSLPTSMYCCKKCSAHRRCSSWRQRRLQLDWAQRSTRWSNLLQTPKLTSVHCRNNVMSVSRPSLCMLLGFMQTWETTSHLGTPNSSPTYQRSYTLLNMSHVCSIWI